LFGAARVSEAALLVKLSGVKGAQEIVTYRVAQFCELLF